MTVKKRAKWGSKTRKCNACGKSNPTKVRVCRGCGGNPRLGQDKEPEKEPEQEKITPKVLAKPQPEPAFNGDGARVLVREGLVKLLAELQAEQLSLERKIEEVKGLIKSCTRPRQV